MGIDPFIDYYELFRVGPTADLESIQRVHRALSIRYHPDNVETGDLERFLRVNEAYRILSDPDMRREYNAAYKANKVTPLPIVQTREFTDGIDGEANRRIGLLCLLYSVRRSNSMNPALSVLEIEQMMSIPREHLSFTIWYLKSKHYIQQDDRRSLEITADGIDFLEANLSGNRTMFKLLEAAGAGAERGNAVEMGPAVVPTHTES